MGKELVVSSDRHETKVAVLEDGQLVEIYFQRSNEYSLAGSIHKGRVTRVLPGMQSAFVDLGLERDTFLYVSDFFEENEDFDQVSDDRRGGADRGGDNRRGDDRRSARPPRREEPAAPEDIQGAEPPAEEKPEVASAAGENGENPANSQQAGRRFDDRNDDRRGRRRRRGRGRMSGRFPDAKFASAPGAEPGSDSEQPIVEAEDAGPALGEEDPIVLPGESLRKYHRAAAGSPLPAIHEPEDDAFASPVGGVPQDLAELDNSDMLAPVPEPDAPVHHPIYREGELSVEAVIDEEEIETAGEDEPGNEGPEPELDDQTEGLPVGQPGDAEEIQPGEADPELETPGAEPLDLIESIETLDELTDTADENEETGEEVAEEGQPSLEPTVQTAHLREPAGRFLEQRPGGRRNRRRGRGGDRRQNRPDQRPAGERAPNAPVEQRQDREERAPRVERTAQTSISDLLKEGQEILVQIAKEPLGQKGARITSHIALPGRFCVYMPTVEHAGVSRKIASDEERQRLKRILLTHRQGIPGGFIIRTAGEGKTEAEIAADIQYLYSAWLDIRQKAEKKKAPAVIYHDLDIVERLLRDQLSEEFKSIWCDSESVYESVLRFVQRMMPALVSRVKMFTRNVPIFDAFSISSELEKALRPKVWLKSGGYIVINQTEALVAIDINTGKFVGKTGRLEDTIVKTNIEAVKEIVRQIRLRDLGGIIVIDFIDMDERKNRQKVMQALEEAMRTDRAPYKILQFNDFGLVAITRKRVKQSLERTLCQPCPDCEGAGYVKSVQTVIGEILAEARKIASAVEGKECLLRANPEVAKVLKSTSNTYVEELEEILKRPVAVIADPVIHHEKFDLS
jgi:ribonuclease G